MALLMVIPDETAYHAEYEASCICIPRYVNRSIHIIE